MSLKDKIFAADDLPREKVEVSEWGLTVYVRSMTGKERDVYEADLMEISELPLKERLHNMRSKLAVLCTVDEKGNRVFADTDVETLGNKSAKAISKITDIAQILNGLTDKSIEDIAKN